MNEQTPSRERVLVAIVAAAGDTGLDRAQLQKTVFLVGQEFDDKLPADFYQFRPYMYGPFTQEVYSDVERLTDGLVVETLTGKRGRVAYRLAPDTSVALGSLPDDLEAGVGRIVAWVKSMTFNELVRAIYYLYPEQQRNSIFDDYTNEKAQEESFKRGFDEIAAGGGRPALELADELFAPS